MKKEKYRDVSVYYENGEVAVTVTKVIVKQGFMSSFSKQHIVRRLPFFYKANHFGGLSIGANANIAELHKGDIIKVTKYGNIVLTNGKKEKRTFSL